MELSPKFPMDSMEHDPTSCMETVETMATVLPVLSVCAASVFPVLSVPAASAADSHVLREHQRHSRKLCRLLMRA